MSAKNLSENYQALKGKLNFQLIQLPEVTAFAFSPPAIPGLGVAGGVSFVLQDRADRGVQYLAGNVETFLAAARERSELARVTTTFLPNVPQVYISVDRDKALQQGVALTDIYNTLQTFLGGSFVNYFNRFGRQWQVYIQADDSFRTDAEQIGRFYVRNSNNNPVPLSAVTQIKRRFGPEFTMRYNLYRAAQIQVLPAPGFSSAQAMRALEEVFARTMPHEMGYDYLGMSFQEKKAQQGISPAAIFGCSLLFVFLILAGLYESWSLPFSVLLSTPVAVFGTLGALDLRRSSDLRNFSAGHGPGREQRLCADRAGDDHRAGGQKRDFDRRICQGGIREWSDHHGGRSRGGQTAPSPHRDDFARFHCRLCAARLRFRLGSGRSTSPWYRSHRWNAGCQWNRYLLHPGGILPGRTDHRLDPARRDAQKAHSIFGFGRRDGRNPDRMSSFFVNRPIVAIVISLVTLIAGAISVIFLPVSLFPEIVTPETVVTANYTGADALTVERSVAVPIEQQMTGVDNMNYMYSLNSNSGQMVLTVDFDLNTDPNTDQILVQMRQTQASSQLPVCREQSWGHSAKIPRRSVDGDLALLSGREPGRPLPF